MALFGSKKGKNAAPGDAVAPNTAGNGAGTLEPDVAENGETLAAAPAGKNKKIRAPKSPAAKKIKNGTVVGVNIGTDLIKAVEVTSKNGELTITAMGAVPTPPDSISNGVVMSVGALSEALKELWRTAGIKSKTVVSSVSGTGSLVVRVIEVPKMTDRELSDNMKVDADRYIPFPPTEVVMDFKALRELPTDPDNPNMDVLLAAAQREIIDLHIKAIQQARLDPRSIDVEPLAAARALQHGQSQADGNDYVDYNDVSAIVNIGATGTEISVLRGDVLVFTRSVPGGGNSITQAIADAMGIHFTDAERLKVDAADALPPQGMAATQTADDFGHEFADFGMDEETQPISFDDFDTHPTGSSGGSSDPFDLDFFNQGPKNEPDAGHGQKEGEDDKDNAPIAFNFNFGDSEPSAAEIPSIAPPEPAAPAAAAAPSTESPEQLLPSKAQPVAETPETITFPGGVSFDFDDDSVLPSMDPTVAASTTVISDDSTLPSVDAGVLERTGIAPIQPDDVLPSTVPSAFDFGDLELPSLDVPGARFSQNVPAAPTVTSFADLPVEPAPAPAATPVPVPATEPVPAPEQAATPFSFSFSDSPAPAPAPAPTPEPAPAPEPAPTAPPLSFSLQDTAPPASPAPEPAPTPVQEDTNTFDAPTQPFSFDAPATTPAAAEEATFMVTGTGDVAPAAEPVTASEAGAGDFDLDAIFGTGAPAPAASDETNMFETEPIQDAGGFDMGGIGGDFNDFGGGLGEGINTGLADEEFSSFGAGLVDGGAMTGVDAVVLYNAIHPALENLAAEIRRSLEFHLSRYPDSTISRISIIGGGANLLNLEMYLNQMIGIPTTVGNPFVQMKINAPKLPPDYAKDNGPICAVALGLALRDFVA